jgi:hypothetical protein
MKLFDYNKYLRNNPLLQESINEIAEAATSELKLKGPDQDELIDAIKFLNNGIGKGNQKVKLPFGNNTLKALDKDGKKDGAAFSIRVKPTKSGAEYIKSVNDFLDDHGFGCKLTGTKVNEAKNNPLLKESFMGPDTDAYEEAQNILDDILSERDWMEIADMTFEDALDTVEAYGHRGQKAQDIANKLVALAQNS